MDAFDTPGLTACSLCAGETLGESPDGQLRRLRRLGAAGVARVAEVECLDRCERGDVVVARPGPAARRQGGRPVWFSGVAGEAVTGDLAGWLAAGGPGRADLPPALRQRRIDPPAT
ncbi:hypothetical protein [Thalassiella azotivora]